MPITITIKEPNREACEYRVDEGMNGGLPVARQNAIRMLQATWREEGSTAIIDRDGVSVIRMTKPFSAIMEEELQ